MGLISPQSPEASGQILHIILDLTFGVSQFLKHGGRCFPRNFTLNVEVAHRVAMALVLAQDFGGQFCFVRLAVLCLLSS